MKKIIIAMLFIVIGATVYAQAGINNNGYVNNPYHYRFYCEDGVLFIKYPNRDSPSDDNILVKYPQSKTLSSYTIPDWVKTIAKGAFQGNNYIETIKIPSSVRYIGDNAFDDCKNLKSIQMYESASAVRAVENDEKHSEAKEVGRYNIQGVKIEEGEDGQVQIILYSDGTSKKVIE